MITAPDGTLYIVDMYRGIIQQGKLDEERVTYLREQIEAHDFQTGNADGPRSHLSACVTRGFERGPQPRMLDETPAQWVQHLSHPNGWWRDTAQKLLVLRRDSSRSVPALEKLAKQRRRRIRALACMRCGRSRGSVHSMTNSSCAR